MRDMGCPRCGYALCEIGQTVICMRCGWRTEERQESGWGKE